MHDTIEFIRRMPKAELHVHLEGSVRPETLLKLARRHNISLPADNVAGLREWYTFRDFGHFIEIYMTISSCLRTEEDIELIAREFLEGQAEQNVLYSEVTFTPYNQYMNCDLGFHEQMNAVNRAREWARKELGVRTEMIVDIPREQPPEAGLAVARWVRERYGDGVIAMGLGGPEQGNPPSKFREAYQIVHQAGIPCILHAGETDGPLSVWEALEVGRARRIEHGVRAIEDLALLSRLKETQMTLDVCPTSNICLGVYPSLSEHPLPSLIEAGLSVTLNSDDPPMFNTTLTGEYLACQKAFGWGIDQITRLSLAGVERSLLSASEKRDLKARFESELRGLRS